MPKNKKVDRKAIRKAKEREAYRLLPVEEKRRLRREAARRRSTEETALSLERMVELLGTRR